MENNQTHKTSSPNYNKKLLEVLSIKPIAFNPLLAKAIGSVKAGLLLSQLLYWWGKGQNPEWIYKTIDEIEEETALSRYEQDGAIQKIKNLKLVEVKRKGIPAKRHFKLNLGNISKLVCGNSTNLFEENQQSIPETTSEISSDTEREINKEKVLVPLKGKYSDITSLGEAEFQDTAQRYQVSLAFVMSKYDDMVNWHESTGKVRKNWLATLWNFVKRDAIQIRKEASEHVSKRGIDARHIK
ncbi:hypothetical protein A2686_02070 [Candidatus Woesebacteria bacterium RIFCSPHIGHO2_01_FULL_38_10]|uniref:DnaD domain-containing protein n=1 Tax=Candidatus Woesebacteria bacterium RIFCSPLOWO2_01_FULL_39_10b TaxID=1802517 RepID=A0A1F8B9N8_9BACT|nr:MAG: hypothetical protein A2686_02070 [Candidatus Woesebacteria bacterium RIFCSPHIGHO2_01_FULL_38_10]OGM60764.1 MAG: hypothetical protein A2892_01840 [Candidatus Woesebacteria bacterium RIFCSPLOWO2_01_FULL_39_10b]